MNIQEVLQNDKIDFSGIASSYFLIGLLSAFDNRFQAMADKAIKIISWKQFFTIICIQLCKEPPTLKELSMIMGSSHQNVKTILNKLEKKGFVKFAPDQHDRRKQRILLTEECLAFCQENDEHTSRLMQQMFHGISEEQLKMTIQTIIQIETNMENIKER